MKNIQRCKPMLGTFVEISVQDTVSEKALIEITTRVFDVIAQVDQAMSFHDPKSELSEIIAMHTFTPCVFLKICIKC